METLKIDKKNALKLYPKANEEFKTMLEDTFGKNFFSGKITDRVKTFEDACDIASEDPNDEKFKSGTPDEIAYKKLKVIARALNEGWTPDWSNSSEYKYYPWLEYNSGFGFSRYGYVRSTTATSVGSRLCFKSSELAKYAGTQFQSIYNDFFN